MTAWSVESWQGFWAAPLPEVALQRIPTIADSDVQATWPRSRHPVLGPQAYARRVIDLLQLVPDLRLRLEEHVGSDSIHFLRWHALGTGPGGPFEGIGCDRIVLRGGLVLSNLVMSDMAIFEMLEDHVARQTTPRPPAAGPEHGRDRHRPG